MAAPSRGASSAWQRTRGSALPSRAATTKTRSCRRRRLPCDGTTRRPNCRLRRPRCRAGTRRLSSGSSTQRSLSRPLRPAGASTAPHFGAAWAAAVALPPPPRRPTTRWSRERAGATRPTAPLQSAARSRT
eukprot:4734462-Prymnesium_polylepis.1